MLTRKTFIKSICSLYDYFYLLICPILIDIEALSFNWIRTSVITLIWSESWHWPWQQWPACHTVHSGTGYCPQTTPPPRTCSTEPPPGWTRHRHTPSGPGSPPKQTIKNIYYISCNSRHQFYSILQWTECKSCQVSEAERLHTYRHTCLWLTFPHSLQTMLLTMVPW